MTSLSRRQLLSLGTLAAAGALSSASAVKAAPDVLGGRRTLVMVDARGCSYCAKWKNEVEQAYRNSDEGRFAPLEIRDIRHPDLQALSRLIYTPTFVLVDNNREVGRILGYSGDSWFWGEIEGLFKQAGFVPGGAPPAKIEERRT